MKKYKILVGIFILAILGYIYAGPYLTINKIKNSIKNNDPQGLMENIDIIKLKSNFKEHINAKLIAESSSKKAGLLGGIGTVFGGYMMEKVLDMYLTPAGISHFLSSRSQNHNHIKNEVNVDSFSNGLENISTKYISLNKFKITLKDKDKDIDFILSRNGLDWKLSEVIIPL
jgi:Protein of unknown function (DUF2939)